MFAVIIEEFLLIELFEHDIVLESKKYPGSQISQVKLFEHVSQ